MTITTIQLVDTDLSTTLFDLHSSDGSTNSSWGSVITKFGLGGNLKTTAPLDAERFEHPGADGGFTTFSRRALGEASWRQFVSGTTEANLRLGVGRLTDLITRGTILRIVTSTTTRYLRLEPSAYPSSFQGKELELHDIFQQFAFRMGLDIAVACQPYWEGAAVSVSGVTVPNDPATSTKARVYPVAGVTGDLPTPARVRVQQTAGSGTHEAFVAWRARNARASTYFSDYLASTAFAQCEATGRGWTITLGVDTAGASDANASPGSGTSVARCTYATNAASSARVQAVRSAAMDSLRGTFTVRLRCRASAASIHTAQLRWVPATSGTLHENAVVTHDVSGASSFGYVELDLGTIHLPEDPNATLAGLSLYVYCARTSGTGNLDMDLLWLVPAAAQGSMLSSISSLLGANESFSSSPSTSAVHRLDTSGNYAEDLDLEGTLPAILEPGDNHLIVCINTDPLGSYAENQNVLSDISTVSVVYSPRFAL